LKLSPGHFTDFVVLTSGRWPFHVRTPFGGQSVSFTLVHAVS